MLYFFILIFCFLEVKAKGQSDKPLAVLMVSIPKKELAALEKFFPRKTTWEQQIAEKFQNFFQNTSFETQVFFKADGFDIYNLQTNKRIKAVFWMSHHLISEEDTQKNFAFNNTILMDHEGYNIFPVINNFSADLIFLGLITCYGNEIHKIFAKDHPTTFVYYFPNKIKPLKGLESSVKMFLEFLKNAAQTTHLIEPKAIQPVAKMEEIIEIKIIRNISKNFSEAKNFPSIQVSLSNEPHKILMVLPPCANSQRSMLIPKSMLEKSGFKLKIGHGSTDLFRKEFLGRIEVLSEGEKWDVKKHPKTKEPFGESFHIFELQK